YALHFPELIPESLVAADPARLKKFMEALGGEMIVKPLDGCGGAGVFHLHRGDRNLNAILELSTLNGTRMVMAQRYLPAVRSEGDKRLIVLAGEPPGAIRRVPREDEARGNIHVGGRGGRRGGTGSDIRAAGGTGAEAPRLRAFWPPEATGAAHARTDPFACRTTLRSRGEALLAGLPRRAGRDAGAIGVGALTRRAFLGTE